MIVIAELSMTGNAHVEFNAAFLHVCPFNDSKQITFFSEKKHAHAVREKLNDSNLHVNYEPFYAPNVKGNAMSRAFAIVLKEIIAVFVLLQVLNYSKKHKVAHVYITSALPFTHWVLKNVFLKWYTGFNLFFVLHGELERIKHKDNAYYKLMLKALKVNLPNFKYITLAEICKANITSYFKLNPHNFIAIDHPYIYPINNKKTVKPQWKLLLATVGVHNAGFKNSHLIFDIASSLSMSNVKFKTIGKFEPDMLAYLNDSVDYSCSSNDMIPNDIFEQELAQVSYILMFYPKDAYKFMPSGVFFDAIKLEKPIIAIRNSFFEYYFKLLGNIGFLVDNIDEMKVLIGKLDNGEIDCYEEQLNYLHQAKDTLSIANIKKQLSEQLS
jgi:hypothetical protein